MIPNYRCTVAAAKQNQVPEWTAKDAAPFIYVPTESDDKYSHGVLGMVTGSKRYPGAAILGAEAAHHTGVGMVRYLGPRSVARLVLLRRPEVVIVPGKVNAWLIGSGMDAQHRTWGEKRRLRVALESGLPIVIDAGALDLIDQARGPVIITPHARELARLFTQRKAALASEFATIELLTEAIAHDPSAWSQCAADELGVVVLLKGHETHITAPRTSVGTRVHLKITSPTTWLATAGTGDVLAGILAALAATNPTTAANLVQLAATASFILGMTAQQSTAAGPLGASDIIASLPSTIKELAQISHTPGAK